MESTKTSGVKRSPRIPAEKKLEYNQRYNEKHRDVRRMCSAKWDNKQYVCECGRTVRNNYKAAHMRSGIHIRIMQSK